MYGQQVDYGGFITIVVIVGIAALVIGLVASYFLMKAAADAALREYHAAPVKQREVELPQVKPKTAPTDEDWP